jgi:hypothetical protein
LAQDEEPGLRGGEVGGGGGLGEIWRMDVANERGTPVELLLSKHLPYELDMLEHTFRLLHSLDDSAKKN